LKARAWAQLKLQHWYFWFLTIFIVFITAVGGEPLGKLLLIIDHPLSVFPMLSESLPTATHFYLSFVMLQWMIHSMNLTRYVQICKFWFFRRFVSEDRAVELSEPEDQEFYGMGSRSARWSNILMIAIIFSGISPLIAFVSFVHFFVTRLFYGYLIIFAETRKHDLGGVFFVQQLWHLQWSLLLYILVMASIFLHRASEYKILLGLTAASLAYFAWCVWRFQKGARWEYLPFADTCTPAAVEQAEEEMKEYLERVTHGHFSPYIQPELQVTPTCDTPRRMKTPAPQVPMMHASTDDVCSKSSPPMLTRQGSKRASIMKSSSNMTRFFARLNTTDLGDDNAA
jgi:hypothetical protein